MLKKLFNLILCSTLFFTTAIFAAQSRIALIMKTLSNEYFIDMQQGAENAAKKMDVDLIVQVADKEDSTEQLVSLVENMIASKVDGIIVTPNDSTAFVPVFLKAEKAGIPIIDLDVELDRNAAKAAGLTYYYVGVNNHEGGYLAANYLVEKLAANGDVAILEGIPGVDNGEQRKAGALKAFSEAPGIKVVAIQTANWEAEQALNVVTNMLTANPNIKGIFAANDNMAIGAVTAIENAGLAGKILVTGYDAIPLAIQYVKEGKMLATIDQAPAGQAAVALETVLKRINKEPVETAYYHKLAVVTKDNVQ